MMVRPSEKANRITVMLDKEIDKKLRNKQANMIKNTSGTVSFSRVLNEVLRKALK